MLPRTIPIGNCIITLHDAARWLVTWFPDGSALLATDDQSAENVARAASLGFPDTWSMHRSHDPGHQFLAAKAGKPYCDVLFRAAHGSPPDMPPGPEERERVEARVLTFQRWCQLRDNRWDAVHWLYGLGDVDELAAEFRALMGDLP